MATSTARSQIPLVVFDPNTGALAPGAQVSFAFRLGGSATVYQAETGGTTRSQPLTTDASGRLDGWMYRGQYTATITISGHAPTTYNFDVVPGADASVDHVFLGGQEVQSANIAAGAILTTHFASQAVNTAALADAAVTTAKIGDAQVTTAKHADASVTGVKIAPTTVDISNLVTQVANALVPAGTVLSFATAIAPTGFLLCDGNEVPGTYTNLISVLQTGGSPHGTGPNGRPRVPDMRGRGAVGPDNMGGGAAGRLTAAAGHNNAVGQTGGAETHTLDTTQTPSHNHGGATGTGTTGTWANSHSHGNSDSGFAIASSVYTGNSFHIDGAQNWGMKTDSLTQPTDISHSHSVPALSISSVGGGLAHNNMHSYTVLSYVIRHGH